ncbi:hypothetical protein T4C_152 [Trichinella pseudospiralis]|uniref:Uncharacterized protein n=1 Tax=Trichinella pseudospiralis TaxID=6337 RepID=A0A0V1K4P5_TRIPS|nr:hypothetical protein T4C_152 [Trichinella pseudospiralis]
MQITISLKEKLMEQKKMKMRMTRNKSRRALRRTRDEKIQKRRGRHEADRGRHEAEQKEDKRYMRFPVGPNSVSLGLGYFKRVKLSHTSHDRLDRIVRWSFAFVGQIMTRWRRHDLPKSSVKSLSSPREGSNALKTGF